MVKISVDFSEAVELTLVPKGKYSVVVSSAEAKDASTGTRMLVLTLEVTDGEHKGVKLMDNLMLEGKGADRTKQALKALLGDTPAEDFDTDDLIGAVAEVFITHRVWEESDGGDGEERARITKYFTGRTVATTRAGGGLFA
jgi:hypothetical protein